MSMQISQTVHYACVPLVVLTMRDYNIKMSSLFEINKYNEYNYV